MTANPLAAFSQRIERAATIALARLEDEQVRVPYSEASLQSRFNQLLSDELGSSAQRGG